MIGPACYQLVGSARAVLCCAMPCRASWCEPSCANTAEDGPFALHHCVPASAAAPVCACTGSRGHFPPWPPYTRICSVQCSLPGLCSASPALTITTDLLCLQRACMRACVCVSAVVVPAVLQLTTTRTMKVKATPQLRCSECKVCVGRVKCYVCVR